MANVNVGAQPTAADKAKEDTKPKTSVLDLLKEANRQEDKAVPGARLLTSKQSLFEIPQQLKDNPDIHCRWVNLRNAEKSEQRKREGYVRVPHDEGGKSLGDEYAIFAMPRKLADARKEREARINESRINQHKLDMSKAVESVLKEMRDKYGVKIDERNILINEG